MASRLSLLVFSRNDVDDALGLVKDMYDVADDIVLVDSSGKKQHKKLIAYKNRHGLDKLRIYYVIATGYPDPIRMYALKKCRYGWVLLIDTDERLSAYAKGHIKELIAGTDASAFAMKRYENYTGRSKGSFFTWQLRLFRKSDVKFKGVLHEQPSVNGLVEKPADGFYIGHMASLRGRSSGDYSKMAVFDRMSYGIARERLLEYLNKIVVPREGHIKDRPSGKALAALLDAYRRMKFKDDERELSDFDYFWFFCMVDLGYQIKDRKLGAIASIYSSRKAYMKGFGEGRKQKDSGEIFEISKIINTIGITDYLRLDSEATIRRINRKYAGERSGAELLIRLLKERYERGRRWLD